MGEDQRPPVGLPRTERRDAPLYLARYLERQARQRDPRAEPEAPPGDGAPLYLRRFRERQAGAEALEGSPPLPEPGPIGAGDQAFEAQAQWAQTTKSRELVPPARPDGLVGVLDVHIVRHAETQGYSVDGGLTPLGSWQARRRGHDLSKAVAGGRVKIVAAPTARAMQTAEQVRRGLEDGLASWARSAEIEGPEAREVFNNFQFWAPSGVKDVTRAFREYQAVAERYERVALGDRPLWLVEMDRFWHSQEGGGDPIAVWMTIPFLHFEPPAQVVRRFWRGLSELAEEVGEDTRIIVCTHSGPMRVFATWALGHDPGEPYNTEEVRVRIRRSRKEAVVTFRNRSQEVQVPPPGERPVWDGDPARAGLASGGGH